MKNLSSNPFPDNHMTAGECSGVDSVLWLEDDFYRCVANIKPAFKQFMMWIPVYLNHRNKRETRLRQASYAAPNFLLSIGPS